MRRKILLLVALCALLTACAGGGRTELPPYEVKYKPVVVLPEYRVKLPPFVWLEYKNVKVWPVYEKVTTTQPPTRIKPPELRCEPQPETELQRAYLKQLEACRRLNKELPKLPKRSQPYVAHAIGYSLYDIDKDGTPELIILSGEYGNDLYAEVFTCRDGNAVYLGIWYCGASGCLCTWPGKNAMLYIYGHMGAFNATEVYIENGALESRVFFRGQFNNATEYPDPEDLVRGSQDLTWYKIGLDLPVMEYGAERSAGPPQYDEDVRARLTSTVRENGIVCGVDGGLAGEMYFTINEEADAGLASFDKYCFLCIDSQLGPQSFTRGLWADVNGDGREEYVLLTDYGGCLVLSLQDDVVYAYCIYGAGSRLTVYSDGTFLRERDYDWTDEPYTYRKAFRLAFDRDECYTAEQCSGDSARSFADSSAVPVEWQVFEPTEQ